MGNDDPVTSNRTPGVDTLRRAFFFRAMPLLFEAPGTSLGVDLAPPPYLALRGIEGDPIRVLGRLYHALQVSGLADGDAESWQLEASLDGSTYSNLGSAIVADGFVQVTTGLYGYFKVVQAAPIASITIRYVGAETSAAMTIANGHLIVTTLPAGTDSLDIALADYASYTALVSYIDGLTNYTATTQTADADHSPTSLMDVVGAMGVDLPVGSAVVRTLEDGDGADGVAYSLEVRIAATASQALSASITSGAVVVLLGTDATVSPITPDPAKNTATLIAGVIHALTGVSAAVFSGSSAQVRSTAFGPEPYAPNGNGKDIKTAAVALHRGATITLASMR
jgi:hypothetical protein